MSFITRVLHLNQPNFAKISGLTLLSSSSVRNICLTSVHRCEKHDNPEEKDENVKKIDPALDRTKIIPVETSIRYLKSSAYKTTYGDLPVWVPYRRNFKGQIPPKKTRKLCIRAGIIATGKLLSVHHRYVSLNVQFIPQEVLVRSVATSSWYWTITM